MKNFIPTKVYYESGSDKYPLGKELLERYSRMDIEIIEVQDHNKIPELRELPDDQFVKMKKYLVLGIRKSLRLIPNERSADFIVPFTSSGCSAVCLYCYLVCTFFKNSYLRIFVNREDMIKAVQNKANRLGESKIYEIGSNSDLILENTITGNLKWVIEQFGQMDHATATFATKFSMVDDIIGADHRGKTQIRISVNPHEVVKKIEIGTSSLAERIDAANRLFRAGYKIGINIAPIIMIEDWMSKYKELINQLYDNLEEDLKERIFFELIFMTYGYANKIINSASLPGTVDLHNQEIMRPKGRGKYCYHPELREEGGRFLRSIILEKFPKAKISYIV